MKRFLLATVFAALSGSAGAVTTLTLENPGVISYQQTANSPCIFGDNSCQNGGFAEVLEPPGGGSQTYNLTSFTYTVAQFKTVLGAGTTGFTIGIDVNSTTQPVATEALDYFDMKVNGSIVAVYDPPSPGTLLADPNNGNGFSDELLKGFSLAGLSNTDQLTFDMIINTATDGKDQVFLIGANTPVHTPEPVSLALLGVGLAGLGVIRRRKV